MGTADGPTSAIGQTQAMAGVYKQQSTIRNVGAADGPTSTIGHRDDQALMACSGRGHHGFGTAGEFAPDTPTAEWYTAWIANALERISEGRDDDVEIDVVAAGHSAGKLKFRWLVPASLR